MRRKEKKGLKMNKWFKEERLARPLLVGLVLFALLVGTVVVSCGSATEEQQAEDPAEDESRAEVEKSQVETEEPQVETEEPQARADLENPSLGSESAPVVMIEYADYQ